MTVTLPEMTRFLLSLDSAVDTVFEAVTKGKRGQTFVPKVPAANIVDLAKAIMGDKEIPITYTGIRPGEKIHEIMVSEEEAHHCARRGDYFAILPMLPELRRDAAKANALKGEFSSAESLLSLAKTESLLKKHGLL